MIVPQFAYIRDKLAFWLDEELSLRQYEFQTIGGPCYPHVHPRSPYSYEVAGCMRKPKSEGSKTIEV